MSDQQDAPLAVLSHENVIVHSADNRATQSKFKSDVVYLFSENNWEAQLTEKHCSVKV